ncbi:MAG: bifunctional (p)ppGpp synthetase/guanosine-3',5'-bis(diphosphate) 3'-pyrophosphohydrolase, partial [Moraxellaceae bacterium]|nr:bifunctional (p)ppGpp synthetase/guanosine-3',5'-bis(diphosphate) 3'-pyrophosphohydrolase [Moraxellaceae bacterium]
MVKIREGLPLTNGNITQEDSASLTAQLANNSTTHKNISIHTNQPKSVLAQHLENACRDTLAENSPIQEIEKSSVNRQNIDVPAWLATVAKRIGETQLDKLTQAVELIRQVEHDYQGNRSDIFVTGIGMTDILTYLYQDEDALVSAMLYRSVRHNYLTLEEVEEKFGKDISTLVADTLAMGKLSDTIESNKRLENYFVNNEREQLNNIYSMLITTTNDVRVVLIKLAERTFAMRELSFCSEERQQRVAREVMTIYAPLAHRLGIAQLKWELEDLSFRYLAPQDYKRIAKLLSEKRSEREA